MTTEWTKYIVDGESVVDREKRIAAAAQAAGKLPVDYLPALVNAPLVEAKAEFNNARQLVRQGSGDIRRALVKLRDAYPKRDEYGEARCREIEAFTEAIDRALLFFGGAVDEFSDYVDEITGDE